MGWTCTYKKRTTKPQDFLSTAGYVPKKGEILLSMRSGNAVYQAIKIQHDSDKHHMYVLDDNNCFILCAVYLITFKKDIEYNFCYKPLEESMGPSADNCPKKIFNMLSPLTEEYKNKTDFNYAVQWRADVQKNHDEIKRRSFLSKVEDGTKLCFPNELKFTDGQTYPAGTPFKITSIRRRSQKRRVFIRPDGIRVKISSWRKTAELYTEKEGAAA